MNCWFKHVTDMSGMCYGSSVTDGTTAADNTNDASLVNSAFHSRAQSTLQRMSISLSPFYRGGN